MFKESGVKDKERIKREIMLVVLVVLRRQIVPLLVEFVL